eukprot:1478210-Heterocapsa_arctica.AAC.1
MIVGHTKDTEARHAARTLWIKQVKVYLKTQEWDDPKIPVENRNSPLQDDAPFDPNDVIDPGLLTGGCDSSSNPGSDDS